MSTPDFDSEAFQLQNDTSLAATLRRMKAKRLREEGWGNDAIAEACRLPLRLVDAAVETAREEHPDFADEDLNEALFVSMMSDLERMDFIARNPGWLYDVKGSPLLGPDEQWQVNTERQIQAQREKSRLVEAIRKLKGSDAPVRRYLTVEELHRQETAIRIIQTLKPGEIEGVGVVDGEIVYDPGAPSIELPQRRSEDETDR